MGLHQFQARWLSPAGEVPVTLSGGPAQTRASITSLHPTD